MTKSWRTDLRMAVSVLLAVLLCIHSVVPCFAEFTYVSGTTKKAETSTNVELSKLQEQYDALEQKIEQGDKLLSDVESGKKVQSQNIDIIRSNIDDLNKQIDVLEQRVSLLNDDIKKLNSSIRVLNQQISKLNNSITETEEMIYDTSGTVDILYGKIRGRLMINYMAGSASNLEVLLGVKDLPTLFTKLQIIHNLSAYDQEILSSFEESLETLQNLNSVLSADKAALDEKMAVLTGEKTTLSARQSDIESSQYVLDLKKELSEHKYEEAVKYFNSLDETSEDYAAMLKLLSDEQDKVDAEINAYLLKYGSSASDSTEGVTQNSGDGTATTAEPSSTGSSTTKYGGLTAPGAYTGTASAATTAESTTAEITFPLTTAAPVITPESIELIWPVPYKNCYISAQYGQYPSGGAHHGMDICVRGGSEGKNVVAAADGVVISYGFNHWSMGNYIIVDHGYGLFTAYYHMQKLFAEKGDRVKQGQVIGLIGHTGNTTGPHLHFEVRISRNGTITRVNPLKFVSMP